MIVYNQVCKLNFTYLIFILSKMEDIKDDINVNIETDKFVKVKS